MIDTLRLAVWTLTTLILVHLGQGIYMFSETFFTGQIDGANYVIGIFMVMAICGFRLLRVEGSKARLRTLSL